MKWPLILSSLPPGLTIREVMQRAGGTYYSVRMALKRAGYQFRNAPNHVPKRVDLALVDWSMGNAELERWSAGMGKRVSRERWRVIRNAQGVAKVNAQRAKRNNTKEI